VPVGGGPFLRGDPEDEAQVPSAIHDHLRCRTTAFIRLD
jgi:hypothetical protein